MLHFSISFLLRTHTVTILEISLPQSLSMFQSRIKHVLAKFRREVNPDMPEQLYINNLCDTNRNLSFYKEYVHERSEILCGLSVTCINLFNGIILLLACCLDCKESFYNFGPWKPRQLGLIATSSVRVRPTVSRCEEFESVQSLSVGG